MGLLKWYRKITRAFKEIEKIDQIINKPIDVISVSKGYPEYSLSEFSVFILDLEQSTLEKAVYKGQVNAAKFDYYETLVFSLSRVTNELVIRFSFTGSENELNGLDGQSLVGRAEVRQFCK
jgi:hypothetical protein